WWPSTWKAHWQEPVVWPDPQQRVTIVGACINMMVWMICTAGSDQMAIQRYLATKDAQAARRSFGVLLLSQLVVAGLLGLAGLAILGYYTVLPESMPAETTLTLNTDKLLPHFVRTVMPAGLAGPVIVAPLV